MAKALKLTKNQQLVFDCLAASDKAKTAYDLLDDLRDAGMRAPVQIYRALEKLEELDMVHRIESMKAFIACNHRHHDGHVAIFTICNQCGTVAEHCSRVELSTLTKEVVAAGFVPQHTTLELKGLCATCAGQR